MTVPVQHPVVLQTKKKVKASQNLQAQSYDLRRQSWLNKPDGGLFSFSFPFGSYHSLSLFFFLKVVAKMKERRIKIIRGGSEQCHCLKIRILDISVEVRTYKLPRHQSQTLLLTLLNIHSTLTRLSLAKKPSKPWILQFNHQEA